MEMMKAALKPTRYPVEVHFSAEDGGFIALARDLPGCSAFGSSQAEAIAELQDAIVAWIEAAAAAGNPIPEPSENEQSNLPSGKILLRLPRTLHALLAEVAKREGVSLNQHVLSMLSASTSVAQVIHNYSSASIQSGTTVAIGPPVYRYVSALAVGGPGGAGLWANAVTIGAMEYTIPTTRDHLKLLDFPIPPARQAVS